ncbi:hypothetical protein AGLY_010714 [Aphis glycines]|uniref:Reverse transcriptase domain-containing protein n=1 Tax=Aphis glycines TaxID=307491 RepID=A0A6G0TER6_APHGL|nr:hypothetical protein AGLY_010714 [Aphis glycines]
MAERPVTCGVPQGSVLGPTLWNVAYDSLLKMETPPGVQLVGFANDLTVVGTVVSGQQLEDAINPTLTIIDDWMQSRGLELAHQKSEAVVLSGRRAFVPPCLTIGGLLIPLRNDIRYLGVTLDKRLTFAAHASTVAAKAARSAAALFRLMPNIGGSAQWKNRLLASVEESQLLYAAPVWIPSVTEVAKTRAILIRPQRTAALRVIRSYRTVSDEAALVLACMPPVDLLGLERQYIGSRLRAATEPGEQRSSKAVVKREARKTTIVAAWQARWHATPKAAWTRRVIPDLARWLGRTVPAASSRCWQCSDESDTVEHTLFECPHWNGFREALSARIGRRPSTADVPDIICGPAFELLPADAHGKDTILSEAEERFRLFYGMVENTLSAKEEEERVRQAANRRNSP